VLILGVYMFRIAVGVEKETQICFEMLHLWTSAMC
jgi:hypothetical protein